MIKHKQLAKPHDWLLHEYIYTFYDTLDIVHRELHSKLDLLLHFSIIVALKNKLYNDET